MHNLITNIMTTLERTNMIDEELNTTYKVLVTKLSQYNITPSTTEIIVRDMDIPNELYSFLMSKKAEGFSRHTINRYKNRLIHFFHTIKIPLKDVTVNHIRLYLFNLQQNTKLQPITIETYRQAIKSFFKWCDGENLLKINPIENLARIKHTRKPKTVLTPLEIEQIRNVDINIRDKALFEFFYSTGCKLNELININIDDINFDNNSIVIKSQNRTVYFSIRAKLLIMNYLSARTDNNNALFVSQYKHCSRLKRSRIGEILRQLGQQAGLQVSLTPYVLRHTMASHCMDRGMHATSVQKILGHSRLDVTMQYMDAKNKQAQLEHKQCII